MDFGTFRFSGRMCYRPAKSVGVGGHVGGAHAAGRLLLQVPARCLPAIAHKRYNADMKTLTASRGAALLDRIRSTLGLRESELADLFGVRRQSIQEWRTKGVPIARRASVERLVGLARVLREEIIESRIPEIVRTPDEWLDGKNMLETIEQKGVDPIYAYLKRLFSYSK
jgi:transcriptional regulator with XRE-family HTH domain